jgi:7,8-dihydropterin-6-yl-methyl-4-(beta-D-ribofuranosyl)aminobenzene 5'-phosphate synthase
MKKSLLLALIIQTVCSITYAQKISQLRITILSTMLADTAGKGEWGFSALVEADGRKILFDAGTDSNLVVDNAKQCGINLSDISTLILSHSHQDHTGGWHVLRNKFKIINPQAFDTTFLGDGFFDKRFDNSQLFDYSRSKDSVRYMQEGGHIKVIDHFTEIYPGIYLTGPVPRKYNEKNYQKDNRIKSGKDFIEDNIHEDMSLVISTVKGLVLLSGCGHSGIINTVSYMQEYLKDSLYAAIGGFHLFNADEAQIKWTANYLKRAGIKYFVGAHCTGINAVYEIRRLCALKRSDCVVGAVGSFFDLSKGLASGWLAK